MILADKIIELRKKSGMSQEELADKIGVSRQAVSKWESALSTPDMNKILALSELFGVSTDYLLKDSLETPEAAPAQAVHGGSWTDEKLHPVDMETSNRFLDLAKKNAGLTALGVMLCILSPVLLFVLTACSETGVLNITEGQASGMGAVILLLMVAAAVVIFVMNSMHSQPYEYLRQEWLDTAYGVDGMVREKKEEYSPVHMRDMILGIVLCVLSSLPLIIMTLIGENSREEGALIDAGVAILLVMVGIGVFFIVRTSGIWGSYEVLLEEGDYSRENKKLNKHLGSLYWCIVTAVYLLVSFLTMRWDMTWIIWPVTGVFYGVVVQIYKAAKK